MHKSCSKLDNVHGTEVPDFLIFFIYSNHVPGLISINELFVHPIYPEKEVQYELCLMNLVRERGISFCTRMNQNLKTYTIYTQTKVLILLNKPYVDVTIQSNYGRSLSSIVHLIHIELSLYFEGDNSEQMRQITLRCYHFVGWMWFISDKMQENREHIIMDFLFQVSFHIPLFCCPDLLIK